LDEHGVELAVTVAAIVAFMSCVAGVVVVRQRARASEAARRMRAGAPRLSEVVRRREQNFESPVDPANVVVQGKLMDPVVPHPGLEAAMEQGSNV
jgi:hypothetical protein